MGYKETLNLRATSWDLGSWFVVPDNVIFKMSAPDQGWNTSDAKSERRIVLPKKFEESRPRAVVYVRSASSEDGLRHEKHVHENEEDYKQCKIDADGRILDTKPCGVWSKNFEQAFFSCYEPEVSVKNHIAGKEIIQEMRGYPWE